MIKHPAISLALVAAVMALGACSSEPETPQPEPDVAGTDSQNTIIEPELEDPPVEGSIPSAMIGVWDYVEGSCDPASDLRLEIAPDHLTFYESYGTVQSASLRGEIVTVALAMEGEGETWDENLTFRLVDGGTILESNTPSPTGEGPLRRKRCEG